jgi:DNA repair protein SbcC/Rad50
MRLHHLSVTAFGPFVETVEIDFDRLSDAGLFLLSGATGAGKSSVLDAVCFALYGAVPGDRQHAGRLRSDQAPAGLAPRVVLEATLSGRRFRLVRSPAWDRPKKRGTGTTREQAKVTISQYADGAFQPLTSRLDEAGDLVSGLLGMNLDQFCQVALLPQGQFQAFLRADSTQRHRLLSRLFRTGRFERVETWLRDHRADLRRGCEARREVVARLVSRVSEAAGTAVPSALADVTAAAEDGSLDAWVVDLGESAAVHAEAATTELATLLAAESDARQALAQARERATVRARVAGAAQTLARLEAAADRHAGRAARLARARRAESLRPLCELVDDRAAALAEASRRAEESLAAVGPLTDGLLPLESTLGSELDELGLEIAALTALLPAERQLTSLRAHEERRAEALRRLTEQADLEAAEEAALSGRLQRLEAQLADAESAAAELPEVASALAELQGVVAAHDDVARLEAELALLVADHAAAAHRVLDLREHLLDLRERRIAGIAAELAGVLAVGDDCPVCGSREHPHPAVPADGHPDADSERAAQRALDDAQATEAAVSMRVREVEGAVARARASTAELDASAARDRLSTLETRHRGLAEGAARRDQAGAAVRTARERVAALGAAAAERQVRTAEESTALAHLRAQSAELEERVGKARGEHPALALAVRRLESRRAVLRAAHADSVAHELAATSLAEAEVALGRAVLESGFDDPAQARAAALPDPETAALERQVREHETALAAARLVLAEPGADAVLAAPAPDIPALEHQHRLRADALEKARAQEQAAKRLQARLVDLSAELADELTAWAPLRAELDLATRVSSFAEGKAADNRWQMRLSAYVLAYRLSQVVAAANARLAGMSDQRYSLEHVGRRGTGETRGGLSLVVRDDWSGEARDPATLSGGETFVVSLALALGLADVVAHEAGGADLQTLFVDEGFGSLDAETLDDVLDILDSLREGGRAVGVVSHVAEMRDRIPTQLVVSKARSGSTVRVAG